MNNQSQILMSGLSTRVNTKTILTHPNSFRGDFVFSIGGAVAGTHPQCIYYLVPYTALGRRMYFPFHYSDVTMGAMGSQITSLMIVYSTVYSGADLRKYQSSSSLAFVRGIHRWPMNSPHKWPIMRKRFQFDDVIMSYTAVPPLRTNYRPYRRFRTKGTGNLFKLPGWYCIILSWDCNLQVSLEWRHNERDGSQIIGVSSVCATVCSGAAQIKCKSSASLTFVRGIHRWPVDSPHKGPSNAENVSIWWRHHVDYMSTISAATDNRCRCFDDVIWHWYASRNTGPLSGESTWHWWIPLAMRSFYVMCC